MQGKSLFFVAGRLFIFFVAVGAIMAGFFAAPAGGAEPTGKSPAETINCCPEERNDTILMLTEPPMCSEEVREIQTALRKLRFFAGKSTGIFDPATKAAVERFQKSYGLQPDGIVGRETKMALAALFESGVTHTSTPASPKGIVEIVIDKDKKTLTVYENNKVFKQFPVAVGKEETPTPVGEWHIERKARNWGNGFGTRWLGLDVPWGLYGIHGTNKPWSVGTEASGGCIRMFNEDVEQLYGWVKVGTVVRIIGQVLPPLYEQRDKVFRGCKGTAVMLVQKGLIAEGYLKPPIDGDFGETTEEALKRMQKDRGFEVTGQVDVDIWGVLGL